MFGTTDEVTKSQRAVETLTEKLADLEKRRDETGRLQTELDAQRQELLGRIGDGDNDARKQLRSLDDRKQNLSEDGQAFGVSIARVTSALADAKAALKRGERTAAINAAEEQIAALGALEGELDIALRHVHEKLDGFLAACAGIGQSLAALDEKRFASIGPALQQQVHRAVREKFLKPNEDCFAVVRADLQKAVATLRYRLAAGQVTPERGERLFRCRVSVPGLKGVIDLGVGDLVTLTEPESAQLLEDGSIEPAAA